jgi:hypothetical protein
MSCECQYMCEHTSVCMSVYLGSKSNAGNSSQQRRKKQNKKKTKLGIESYHSPARAHRFPFARPPSRALADAAGADHFGDLRRKAARDGLEFVL